MNVNNENEKENVDWTFVRRKHIKIAAKTQTLNKDISHRIQKRNVDRLRKFLISTQNRKESSQIISEMITDVEKIDNKREATTVSVSSDISC